MANNPYVNKVVYGNSTLIDLSADTVAANKMLSGVTAHDASGAQITGSIPEVQQAAPSINVNGVGLITASAAQEAGYVAAGAKSATRQLTTVPGGYITPGTSQITAVAQSRFTTGAIYVRGDANLIPENIAAGVTIFNVTGTHAGGSGNLEFAQIPLTYDGSSYNGDFPTGWYLDQIDPYILPEIIPVVSISCFDPWMGGYSSSPVIITGRDEYALSAEFFGSLSGTITIDSGGGISVYVDNDYGDQTLFVNLIRIVGTIESGGGESGGEMEEGDW